jgi:hypothetical protein
MLFGGAMVYVKNNVYPLLFSDYDVPTNDFAKATEDAEEALVALDRVSTGARPVVLQSILERQRLVMFFQSTDEEGQRHSDCLAGSERCRLVAVDPDGNQTLLPLDRETPLKQLLVLVAALRAYAQGLAAITKADTGPEVVAHVNATLGDVEHLRTSLSNLKGAMKSPSTVSEEFSTPAANPLSWMFGQYVASVKIDGLIHVTKSAKPLVSESSGFLAKSPMIGDGVKVLLTKYVSDAIDALEDSSAQSELDRLINGANVYDQLLLVHPEAVFVHLGQAHDALADRLQEQDLSMADVMVKIRAFLREAETLKDVLVPLGAATEQNVQSR